MEDFGFQVVKVEHHARHLQPHFLVLINNLAKKNHVFSTFALGIQKPSIKKRTVQNCN